MSGRCEKCWDHICTCGWKYRHLSVQKLQEVIAAIQGVLDDKLHGEEERLGFEETTT